MAFRDYIICGECETKIIYDGYDNGRDRLEELWGDPKADFWTVHLLCPDCLKKLRAERDAARADALALATERNNWQSMYQDAMAERDKALARVAELEAQQLRHAPCGPLGYATWEEYRKDNPVPLCDRIDAALCQIALAAAEHERVRSTVVAERARNAGEYDAAINAMLQSRADLVAAIADAGLLTTAPQEPQP